MKRCWIVACVYMAFAMAAAACATEVSNYDPVIARSEAGTGGANGESPAEPLPQPASTVTTADADEVVSARRTRVPSFVAPGFQPDAAALPQLGRRSAGPVSVLGPEIDAAEASIVFALTAFSNATGIEVQYTGTPDADVLLDELIDAGDAPDVVIIPQPGRIGDLADRGLLVPMPANVQDQIAVGYDSFWRQLGSVQDQMYAIPQSGNVKSLVWYQPAVFAQNGYEIPTSLGELEALAGRMRSDGLTPWCVGISSGGASGWPLTDWIEDYMLRLKGPEFYDAWVAHDIPFNDPEVVEIVERVGRTWFRRGNVNGGQMAIDSTTWGQAAEDHLAGECAMHRQASFIAGTYRSAGASLGPDGDVDAFYLPTDSDDFGRVVLGAGTFAAALSDDEGTLALMTYIAAPDYAENRIASRNGGYISAHRLHNTNVYRDAIDRRLAEILVSADPFRFDGSDLMPGPIGAGVFWRAGTTYVGGTSDVYDFVDEVESVWASLEGS